MTEILDLIQDDDDKDNLFIEPPDVCDMTDEDSGDENLDD